MAPHKYSGTEVFRDETTVDWAVRRSREIPLSFLYFFDFQLGEPETGRGRQDVDRGSAIFLEVVLTGQSICFAVLGSRVV